MEAQLLSVWFHTIYWLPSYLTTLLDTYDIACTSISTWSITCNYICHYMLRDWHRQITFQLWHDACPVLLVYTWQYKNHLGNGMTSKYILHNSASLADQRSRAVAIIGGHTSVHYYLYSAIRIAWMTTNGCTQMRAVTNNFVLRLRYIGLMLQVLLFRYPHFHSSPVTYVNSYCKTARLLSLTSSRILPIPY